MDANKRKILEDAGALYPSVVTNADRIRAMTDEELAGWIYQIQDGDAYRKENYLPPLSRTWWLDWLRQEAET